MQNPYWSPQKEEEAAQIVQRKTINSNQRVHNEGGRTYESKEKNRANSFYPNQLKNLIKCAPFATNFI